jgi:lysozyme family protein
MTFDQILADVLRNEGGYVNDPNDAGGETMFGITKAVARASGYTGPMKDLPKARALEIYRGKYIVAPGFGLVGNVSMPIAAELVDTGVNMGPTVAGRFLQRALNGLGDGSLVVDGNVGPATIAALKAFLTKRGAEGERRLLALLNAEQGVRYLELAEARAQNRTFLYGWLGRIAA